MADETLPAITEGDLHKSGLPSTMEMSPGLAIFFNDALYSRCKQIATHMSKADGMMPHHLIGKPEACFAVVSRAIVWKQDPFSVAMATYQTPGGSIGYMGVLIQSILESSGRLEGGVQYELIGDWSKVKGKFRLQEGKSGGKFPVPTWTADDAKGLSVIVSAQIKGEADRRTLEFELIEAFPLNSPLWATAPHRQIKYTACRAFANQAVPSLLMGIPFDVDPTGFYGEPVQDITPPRPAKSEFERPAKPKAEENAPQGSAAPPVPAEAENESASPEPSQGAEEKSGEIIPPKSGKSAFTRAVTENASDPEPIAVKAEMQKPAEEPGEINPKWAEAQETMAKLEQNIHDVEDGGMADYKASGRRIIDGLEGLSDGERDALRGQFTGMVLGEQQRRAQEKKGKKK
jgi:hypothetical protein